MNLHRQPGVAQWELVEPHERNVWQQRAAETNGWDTPANRISAVGLIATLSGLYLATKKGFAAKSIGIGLVAYGRVQDLRDGHVAERTATKSPKGEAIDATVDKIGIAAAIIANSIIRTIPPAEMYAHGFQQTANTVLSLTAKARGNEIHPGLLGKLGTGGIWIATGSHLVAHAIEELGFENPAKKLHMAGSVISSASLAINTTGMLRDYVQSALASNDNLTVENLDSFYYQAALSERALAP